MAFQFSSKAIDLMNASIAADSLLYEEVLNQDRGSYSSFLPAIDLMNASIAAG